MEYDVTMANQGFVVVVDVVVVWVCFLVLSSVSLLVLISFLCRFLKFC